MKILNRRSSWLSSFITGFIGWNGLFIAITLSLSLFGIESWWPITLSITILHTLFLRIFFFRLSLDKNVFNGLIAGGVSGAVTIFGLSQFLYYGLPILILGVITIIGGFVGSSVGFYLSYFHIDDKRIEEAQKDTMYVNYGRDGHWLEPVAFGIICYTVVFIYPLLNFFQSFSYLSSQKQIFAYLNLIIFGAINGLIAAAFSHFYPNKWRNSVIIVGVLILIAGTLGAANGMLLRHMFDSHYASSIAASILTHFTTFVRGNQLTHRYSSPINSGNKL